MAEDFEVNVFVHPQGVLERPVRWSGYAFIENDVVVGGRVRRGVQLWDGLWGEDDVFIGPSVSFTK